MLIRTASAPRLRLQIIGFCSLLLSACQAADAQRFDREILDNAIPGGYGVEVADVDNDGLQDIVALATTPAQFVWYRNPGWEKYTISTTATGNIATAPHDIDGDGDTDLVLASEFNLRASTEGGLVQWLENPGNPLINQEWQAHTIDRIPTSHRLRWADVQGDGRKELINLPIIGVGAVEPDYAVGAQLTAYTVPQNPHTPWPKIVLSDTIEMGHGLTVTDWENDGHEDLLTASFAGVELIQLAHDGQFLDRIPLGEGNRGARPGQGSSEIAVGNMATSGRFVASIEPWHGNELVVYTPNADESLPWARQVIDTELVGGHALLVVDLNNDGNDEIVAGYRSSPYGLYTYRYREDSSQWVRSELNAGGIGVAGLVSADFNRDGFNDIVAIGTATANVVLYLNEAR